MATTTIRLGDLKDRVAAAAEKAGKSTHAYILDAIAESVAHDEQRADFVADAVTRRAQFLSTGRSVSFERMEEYALARARGEGASKPLAAVRSSRRTST